MLNFNLCPDSASSRSWRCAGVTLQKVKAGTSASDQDTYYTQSRSGVLMQHNARGVIGSQTRTVSSETVKSTQILEVAFLYFGDRGGSTPEKK